MRQQAASAVADEAHTRERVPDGEAVPGFQVGLVCVGIAITLPSLYTGGEIARGLGLGEGSVAVLVAALLLSVMSVPSGIVGVRTRLTSYLIVEHVYGRLGARLVNLAFGIVLLGWYAVTAELFGRTLALSSVDLGGPDLPEWVWTLASSALVIVTAIYGFKALDRLALVAVPLLTLFLCAFVFMALGDQGLGDLFVLEGEGMAFTDGVSILIGAMITNVVLMPDLTRYARSDRDAFVRGLPRQRRRHRHLHQPRHDSCARARRARSHSSGSSCSASGLSRSSCSCSRPGPRTA